jgi:2',3'-cyclic-nucleotide 2'-phosphodiesterase (5'-nucleotidase family)
MVRAQNNDKTLAHSWQVPVINALKVDCSLVGNHDFDFGRLYSVERQRFTIVIQAILT